MRLPLDATLRGRLVRRYKRFLADVRLEGGEELTAHCANPGSMSGLDRPGAAVRLQHHTDPKRKLAHSLEMVRVGRTWVGVNTHRANPLVGIALERDRLPGLEGYASVEREVRCGTSRLDFRLSGHPRDPRPCWVEVKSVTLAAPPLARFPDAVTERGRRHLEVLEGLARQGDRAVLLFVVQRADCDRVAPADDIDPAYGKALRHAAGRRVEVRAVGARVGSRGIRLERVLPVDLS